MSFQYVPTQLRSPTIPNWNPQKGFWRGIEADSGLLAFNTDNGNLGYYVITQNLWTYRLKIDNAIYSPVFNDVNGYIYWKYGSSFFIIPGVTAGFSTTGFRDMSRRKTTIQRPGNMRETPFTRVRFRRSKITATAIFSHAGRTGTEVEQTRRFISISPAGRASIECSLENMNRKAVFPEEIFRSSPLAGQQFQLLHSLSGKEERTLLLRRNSV